MDILIIPVPTIIQLYRDCKDFFGPARNKFCEVQDHVRQENQNDGNGRRAGGTGLRGHDGGADPLSHERLRESGRLLRAAVRLAAGPWYGFAAGGIGSMLADIFLGYAHYAPGTLVIKGVMALVAALMYERWAALRPPASPVAL